MRSRDNTRVLLRIAQHLKLPMREAKPILTSVLNGAALPPSQDKNAWLKQLRRASRALRMLACTQLPEVYEKLRSDESKRRCVSQLVSAAETR